MCRVALFLRTCFHSKVKTGGRRRVGNRFLLGPMDVHFLPALTADLVALPVASDLSTPLITPTATVCRMSRTANRPSGGYWAKVSTHIGFDGVIKTMAASPDLTFLGKSSIFLPERLSIFSLSSVNLQAIWAVWQSKTGE